MAVPFPWAVGLIAVGAALRIGTWLIQGQRERAGRRPAGTAVNLGRDPRGRPVVLSDAQLATHGLVLGASGAGKSTTLLRIVSDRIAQQMPVVAIDLKGSPGFAEELRAAATAANRPFRLWTLDGPAQWNPVAHGNATELKDKLIASERFTEPHYRRAAERYVQTALQVLARTGRRSSLEDVVSLLDPRRLAAAARALPAPAAARVQDYLGALTPDQLSAVRGLETRLALLAESSAGRFLSPPGSSGPDVDLRRALAGEEIALFSLNSSRYGGLAAQVGTLAIQDLISATGERLEGRPATGAALAAGAATVAIDEFSALGADHVLALLARGREAGVSVLLATQEMADLERAAPGFRDQVLGLTAVKIAHRQDVPQSAQTIAQMAGTEQTWEVTRPLAGPLGGGAGSRGSKRLGERFVVHPNEIKTLPTGEAVMLVKTPTASVHRVRVDPVARDR
jgi:hypothetical protein